MDMTFKNIKEKLLVADTKLTRDWNLNYTVPETRALILLNEHRQTLLSGAVLSLLDRLIEQEKNIETNTKEHIGMGAISPTVDELLSENPKLRECVQFLIDGCRNTEEGKKALVLWNRYRGF